MEASQLYAAMSPVFWIGRVSGVFPFSSDFSISIFWILFPPALFGLITTNAYFFYSYGVQFEGFANTMYFGLAFTNYIALSALIIFSFSAGSLYKTVVTTVSEIEGFLFQLGVQFKYNTKVIMLDILLRMGIITIIGIINWHKYITTPLQLYLRTIGFYLSHWCIMCVEMQIVALTTYLSCLVSSMTSSLPSTDIEGFLEASTYLVDVARNVQELFSKPCLVISGAIFMCTTLDFYFLIFETTKVTTGTVKWFALGRSTTRCYQLWRLVSTVSSLSDEAKQLDAKLYTLALEDQTNLISKKKKLILYFSMKQKMEITACGLFPLNLALIHSIVAAVTNYLVILVQFDYSSS